MYYGGTGEGIKIIQHKKGDEAEEFVLKWVKSIRTYVHSGVSRRGQKR